VSARALVAVLLGVLLVLALAALALAAALTGPLEPTVRDSAARILVGVSGAIVLWSVLTLVLLNIRIVGPLRRMARGLTYLAGNGSFAHPLADEPGKELSDIVGAVNTLQDAYLSHDEELRDTAALLEDVTSRDPLTQLVNRRAAAETLEREMRRSRRNGLPLSILILDVDDLSRVNDVEGFAAGDRMLHEIAVAASADLRATDLVARWGGDELLTVLVDTNLAGAEHVAQGMRTRIEESQAHKSRPVTVSIGVAAFDGRESVHSDEFCAYAEAAVHKAKSAGGNRVEIAR
jgi:diguanylate cyclase (GGDEF)-like protein